VVALSEMRDTVGLIMMSQGVDISGSFTKTQFEAGAAEVTKRVSDGNIRRIKGNSYLTDLQSGNAVAGIVWSGDIFVLRAETKNDNWEFVLPESMIFTDEWPLYKGVGKHFAGHKRIKHKQRVYVLDGPASRSHSLQRIESSRCANRGGSGTVTSASHG